MPSYDERLHVPWWWWVGGGTLVSGVILVYVVWTPLWVACVVGVLLVTLFVLGLWRYGSVRVRVDETGLRVGSAILPVPSIGKVRVVDTAARRKLLGPDADARAGVLLRGYIPEGVQIQVIDPTATEPYWFVSSRRPYALADALAGVTATR